MRTLNLGILAHVDAGKTTLTERLLFSAGAIDQIGSVDAGTTQTDSLELERERGITIRSAVASFALGDLAVNLVDTPGHPDFVAEVERVLGVLDGAILVVSAVEGVQPQTPLLYRALRRVGVPCLIFINKIDRMGADVAGTLAAMKRRLSPAMVLMGAVEDAGIRPARFVPADQRDPAFRVRVAETLADVDEGIFREFVRDEAGLSAARLHESLANHARAGRIHPVFAGSAATGAGLDALAAGIVALLPAAPGDPEGPPSGRVFKIERTTSGERIAYLRMFEGTLQVRRRVRVGQADQDAKPSSISVFAPGSGPRATTVRAGEMARVWGLGAVRIGDTVGERAQGEGDDQVQQFALPSLESVVAPRQPSQTGSLRAALARLAEQDPLINVRQDDLRHEISVSLYGEVQKEVIQATLARDYGIEADFRETTTLCIERPARTGEADEVIRAKTKSNITGRSSPYSTNPFTATLGLRIEPAAPGSGITFLLDIEPRLIPLYIFRTREQMAVQMESFVRETLAEGLQGWQVTDCRVTMWDSGYTSPSSTPADFRRLTQLVLTTALARAGTWVCEPLAELDLELPSASAPGTLALLARIGGRVRGQFAANGLTRVDAVLPVAHVRDIQHELPGLSAGEGVLETRPGGYQPVGGTPPRRPRTSPSPLARDEWLAWLARRG